jgi:hypothetical protein
MGVHVGCFRLTVICLSFSLVFGIEALIVYAFGPFDTVIVGSLVIPVEWASWLNLGMVSAGLAGLGILYPVFLCFLDCCGFRAEGVGAGSCAAFCQSCYGDVPAGSWFSCCQSVGADPRSRGYISVRI